MSESARPRTHHGDDEHDEEGVAHGDEGDGEGGEDLLGGLEAAEEADDAEGAQHADGEVEGAEDDEGHDDDEGVEEGPSVAEEGAGAVGEEVEEDLGGEDGGEGGVEGLEGLLGGGGGAVGGVEAVRLQLRLDHRGAEILRRERGQLVRRLPARIWRWWLGITATIRSADIPWNGAELYISRTLFCSSSHFVLAAAFSAASLDRCKRSAMVAVSSFSDAARRKYFRPAFCPFCRVRIWNAFVKSMTASKLFLGCCC